MVKVIYLFWHRKRNHFNFGDDVNPYIITKLSGCEVRKVMVLNKKKSIIIDFLRLTRGFINGSYGLSVFKEYYRSLIHPNYIVSIGSILHFNFSKEAKVWGSGIIESKSPVQESDFYAVRGLKTVQRLKELNYKFEGKIGDPAMLLPLIYQTQQKRKKRIGIVPHVTHYDRIKEFIRDESQYVVINLNDNEIERTLDVFQSCEFVISSSLHGLIISHAYNIPALHANLGTKLAGDGIKFDDYFSSVGIESYNELTITNNQIINTEYINNLFKERMHYALPDSLVVTKIQKDLLSVAPFTLTDKYQSYLEK